MFSCSSRLASSGLERGWRFHHGPQLGMLREAPGSAPELRGHAGAAAASLKAPPVRPWEPGSPCLHGSRRDSGSPAPCGRFHQRLPRGGPARRGARPWLWAGPGRADGTAEAREGCLFLTSGLPRCSPPSATGCPGLGAATQECPARTCGGAPVQKWEVGWGGFPSLCILKGLRTLPRSPNLLLRVPGWTTAAAHAKT